MSVRILVVEGDSEAASALSELLATEGYDVRTVASGGEALEICKSSERPDLIILELMLPDISGTEVCRQLRQAHHRAGSIPILILSVKDDDIDRVVGFELGADDYLGKPYDPRELLLRVQAILRRSSSEQRGGRELQSGNLRLDRDAHRVWVDSKLISLTPTEFRLLETLMLRKGRSQSRERLLQDVWGSATAENTRTVDTHIRRLREKLGTAGPRVHTVRGVGYCFGYEREDDD